MQPVKQPQSLVNTWYLNRCLNKINKKSMQYVLLDKKCSYSGGLIVKLWVEAAYKLWVEAVYLSYYNYNSPESVYPRITQKTKQNKCKFLLKVHS